MYKHQLLCAYTNSFMIVLYCYVFLQLSDSSGTSSPIIHARGSPKPLPYWRRNTNSIAGGPFGRRIRNHTPRIIPDSMELTRRSLNSTCTSPSHSNSSENVSPPQTTTLTRPCTPPHHQIYGHAVNPERVEEWLSTNSPESLADITPPCSANRVSHPLVNGDCVPISPLNSCTSTLIKHGLNTPRRATRDGLTVQSRSASRKHKFPKPLSHYQSSIKTLKKFKTQLKSPEKDKDSHYTVASSSDTTPPLSPLRLPGKNTGLSTDYIETGHSSQPAMSSKNSISGIVDSKDRPSVVNEKRLTLGSSSKETESSLSSYTIPRLGTRTDRSPHDKPSSVSLSHPASAGYTHPRIQNSDIPSRAISSHSKSHTTSSPTSSHKERSFTPSRKVQGTATLSVGKGVTASHAKKHKHSVNQPLRRVSVSQQFSCSSESSDSGEHCSRKLHHQKVSKRPRLSSDSESSLYSHSHEGHKQHKTNALSQSNSPMSSHTPMLSQSVKRKKTNDSPMSFHTDGYSERKSSSDAVNSDGGSTSKSSSSLHHVPPPQRRHTMDSPHSNSSSKVPFSPHNVSGSHTPHRSPTIKSPNRIRTKTAMKKSSDNRRRSSTSDVLSDSKRKRSSASCSDGALSSPSRLAATGSQHSKSDNNDRRKPTVLSFNDSPCSQSSTSQQRLNQESPRDRHAKRISPTVKDHLKQWTLSRHGDELNKQHQEEKEVGSRSKDDASFVASQSSLKSPSHKRHIEHSSSPSQRKHTSSSCSSHNGSTSHGICSVGSPKWDQSSKKTGTYLNDTSHSNHNLQKDHNSSSSHRKPLEVSSTLHHSQALHNVQSTLPSPLSDSKYSGTNSLNHFSEPVQKLSNETSMCDISMEESELFSPQNLPPKKHSKDSSRAVPSGTNSTCFSRYISHTSLSSTTSSLFCNTMVSSTTGDPPVNWKMYGCDLTSDLTSSCAFNKFAQGHLDNFAESFNNGGYSLYNYLHVLERLLAQGSFIPSEKLLQVLDIVQSNGDQYFLTRMHTLLLQDLSIRKDTTVDKRKLWEMMESCLEKCQSLPVHLSSMIILNYILNVFLKDLNTHSSELNSSLVEKVLSLQSHYSHIRKLLDLVFSLPRTGSHTVCDSEVPSLLDVTLSLVCLPLLSCTELDRKDAATKLARDISTRLNGLDSIHTKCHILEMIPSNYLREKIIDLYLEREFTLLPQINSASVFTGSSLSLTKISQVHLNRTPYHQNGSPHSLSFFLRLLCMLLQSHLHTLNGTPLVTSLSTVNRPQFGVNSASLTSSEEIQQGLSSMNRRVCGLANRLLNDEIFCVEMTDPVNWFYFELLTSITSS